MSTNGLFLAQQTVSNLQWGLIGLHPKAEIFRSRKLESFEAVRRKVENESLRKTKGKI